MLSHFSLTAGLLLFGLTLRFALSASGSVTLLQAVRNVYFG